LIAWWQELEYFALAVKQAGAFVLVSDDLSGYLALYKKHHKKLLQETWLQRTNNYEQSVYTTWQISYDRLTPLARTFLQHCALLHYDGISEDIFRNAAANQHDDDPKIVTDFLQNFMDADQSWNPLLFFNITKEL
jgi:hypothetical protein